MASFLISSGSEPERLVHQDGGDTSRSDGVVDDKETIHSAGNPVSLAGPGVFRREAVLIDASQPGVQIGDDLFDHR